MQYSPADAEQVFNLVDREVWAVTASTGPKRGGLLATFVQRSSIDPAEPMVLAGLAANHFTTELVGASRAFGLHLIDAEQLGRLWQFAINSGRELDKLAGLEVEQKITGTPILNDCLAWLDCRVVDQHSTGDRIYFWADVVAAGLVKPGTPVRERALLGLASPEQLGALKSAMQSDRELQRPLRHQWRHERALPDPKTHQAT